MRAQVKMFETVGVLIVFFFLLVTAGAFYFGVQKKSLEDERMRAADMQGLQTALRVLFLPELDCSQLGVVKENCIDKIKLRGFSELLKDPSVVEDYFEGLGFSKVVVRQAWPCSVDNIYCKGIVLYNNTAPSEYTASTVSPVLLLDPWRDENAFGVIEVSVYA